MKKVTQFTTKIFDANLLAWVMGETHRHGVRPRQILEEAVRVYKKEVMQVRLAEGYRKLGSETATGSVK